MMMSKNVHLLPTLYILFSVTILAIIKALKVKFSYSKRTFGNAEKRENSRAERVYLFRIQVS